MSKKIIDWNNEIENQRTSGLSIEEYCKANSLSKATFFRKKKMIDTTVVISPIKTDKYTIMPNALIEMEGKLSACALDVLSIIIFQKAIHFGENIENHCYSIDPHKYVGMLKGRDDEDLEANAVYNHIKKGIEDLLSMKIKYEGVEVNDERGNAAINVLLGVFERDSDGIMKVYLNPAFSPVLDKSDQVKNFTKADLKYQMSLGSALDKRLYFMNKRYEHTKRRWDKQEDLRIKLGVSADMTQSYFLKTLDESSKKISKKTDINLSLNKKESIKHKVQGGEYYDVIVFDIEPKECAPQLAVNSINLCGELFPILPAQDIENICQKAEYDIDKIKKCRSAVDAYPKKIENLTGFILNYIEKGCSDIVSIDAKVKKNSFTDFPQRQYTDTDLDELERRKLGLTV